MSGAEVASPPAEAAGNSLQAGCCAAAQADALSRSLYATLMQRELRPSRGITPRPFFSDFSSSGGRASGVLSILSPYASRVPPPFSIRFAQTPQLCHMVVCVDEEGYLSIVDTSARLPDNVQDSHMFNAGTQWLAHRNAVFDVTWLDGDSRLCTASGDQRAKVWDVATQRCLAVLRGHTGSLKSCAARADAPWALATAARDGKVCLWDLRLPTRTQAGLPDAALAPCGVIHFAGAAAKRRKAPPTPLTPLSATTPPQCSVTSVLFLRDGATLAAGGATDSCVKLWDARQLTSPVLLARCPRIEHGANAGDRRPRAVTALACDPDGHRMLASYSDSTLCLFDAARPDAGSIASFRGHTAPSFYVKIGISPCGSHVVSGSSDQKVYIWQTSRPQDPPHQLVGHQGDVTAVDWCNGHPERIASCSDDGTLRIWNLQRGDAPRPRAVAPRLLRPLRARGEAQGHAEDETAEAPAAAVALRAADGVAATPHAVPLWSAAGGRTLLVRTLTTFFTHLDSGGAAPGTAASPPGRIRLALARSKPKPSAKKLAAGAAVSSLELGAAPAGTG